MEIRDDAEVGSIERELHVEAPPEVVFDVVSNPEHVSRWWSDADFELVPGTNGTITFGDPESGGHVATLSVVEAVAPRTFSFRWTHAADEVAGSGNSFLVTFTLTPERGGTRVHFVETGFRERGWEAAVVAETYADHVAGWTRFLPGVAPCAEALEARP